MLARHDEQLAHHPAAFADVFLHELRAGHADEFAVGVVRYCAREERFAGPGGAVEEHALGLGDAEGFEELGVLEAELDDFFDFFDLLRQAADHVVGAVWDFFDHHEGDEGVDAGGERFLELVGVGEEGDAFADGEFGDVDGVGDVNDWGGELAVVRERSWG